MTTQSNVTQLPLVDRLWAWFETNKKPALLGVGLAGAAALVIWFVIWQQAQKELAAGQALTKVSTAQMVGASPRADAAAAYLEVAARYPNSAAAARASLLAAGSLFTEGKYAEAQQQFEKFTRAYQGSPFLGQALLGVASSLEAQGKTDQAISAYKDLAARHPNDSVIPQTHLALGRLYEAQSKPELARDQYELAERSALPMSSIVNDAAMRLEELNVKYPKPPPPALPPSPIPLLPPRVLTSNAPPPPPATNAPATPAVTNASAPK